MTTSAPTGPLPSRPRAERLGLVLSGGAARGAYEAGALRYLYCDLAAELGPRAWPSIISGTSVGAINGAFVASHDADDVRRLSAIWQQMQIPDIYRLPGGGMFSVVRNLFWPEQERSLLDASPLAALLREKLPLDGMWRNVDRRAVDAFICVVTDLADGANTVYLDTAHPDLTWTPISGTRLLHERVAHAHLLASAAIPLLFPPGRLGDRWCVDGALRQNTPLRPVIQCGATRALIIGLQATRKVIEAQPIEDAVPSLPFLLGKSLNALMLDPVARDAYQAKLVNQIIDWGTATYGPAFADQIAADLRLRSVSVMHLRPSEDLGKIATTVYRATPPEVDRRLRWMLDRVSDTANEETTESDLLSYLLFDRAYTGELERLGWEDARARRDELVAFLPWGSGIST